MWEDVRDPTRGLFWSVAFLLFSTAAAAATYWVHPVFVVFAILGLPFSLAALILYLDGE